MSRHFMREANLLNAPLKPTWTSFMVQTRHELTLNDIRLGAWQNEISCAKTHTSRFAPLALASSEE